MPPTVTITRPLLVSLQMDVTLQGNKDMHLQEQIHGKHDSICPYVIQTASHPDMWQWHQWLALQEIEAPAHTTWSSGIFGLATLLAMQQPRLEGRNRCHQVMHHATVMAFGDRPDVNAKCKCRI